MTVQEGTETGSATHKKTILELYTMRRCHIELSACGALAYINASSEFKIPGVFFTLSEDIP